MKPLSSPILAVLPLLAGALSALSVASAHAGLVDCLIEPRQTIEVRPYTEGLVAKVLVQRGDTVRAGQVLVELEAGLERASADVARYRSQMVGTVKSRESRLEFLAQKAGRREKLVKENYISVQDRDESAAEHRLAQAELLDAEDTRKLAGLEYQRSMEQLRLRTIRSPIDGIVVDRMINPGELADNRDIRKPLLKLAEINLLYVEVLLPSAAYGAVKAGEQIEVIPDQPAGKRFTGTVKVIDKVFDAASGTFGVRLALPNPGGVIPAGVKCKAEFAAVPGPARPHMSSYSPSYAPNHGPAKPATTR
ncbi:efflux RND transporter periplasmic adaptor subunit [Pseudoduganella sp. LjRoot289]|uniref:efflux RND transporter periplasmic adaptor subunit n=1 Tax=Pseudoduganella sp. LjRoot289 TaxID=3342314 RepID=UPI003ED14B0F